MASMLFLDMNFQSAFKYTNDDHIFIFGNIVNEIFKEEGSRLPSGLQILVHLY